MPAKLVLIIDDDLGVQEAIRDALEDEGHSVAVAGDGAIALGQLRSGMHPDLIVLDHMMPVMDGPTFVSEVHKDPALQGLSIVLLTADGRANQKASAMGVQAYLHKPLRIEQLLAIIDNGVPADSD
jgi:CheY-like chemotaxis protein